MRTVKKLIGELPLNMNDIARLVLEATEELGEVYIQGRGRVEVMQLLRRVVRAGVKVVQEEESTVSFETAAWASVDARCNRRPTTRRDLKHFVRRMLRIDGVGERPLRRMTRKECRKILADAFGRSVHSYRKGRAIMHSIFAWGQHHDYCSQNPVDGIECPAVEEKEIEPLTMEEVLRLEKAVEHSEHQVMSWSLHLLLYCGLRPSEVARLNVADINLDERFVVIRSKVSKTGGGRVVPLRKLERLRGTVPYIPRNWQNRWRSLRRAAEFASGRWVPDVCRHSFASYHAACYKNLPQLQLEMGHRDSTLLRSRYIYPVPEAVGRRYWQESNNL